MVDKGKRKDDLTGPAPKKFQWEEGDIEWIKPPKSLKKEKKGDGDDTNDPLPLPDWFAGIRFASWNATGTSERIVAPT